MGKPARRSERRERKNKVGNTATSNISSSAKNDINSNVNCLLTTIITIVVLPSTVTAIAWILGTNSTYHSSAEGGRPNFVIRLVLSIFLDSIYGHVFYVLLIPLSRMVARNLPGAVVPNNSTECEIQENEMNDPSFTWPLPNTDLPPDWVASADSRKQQPYFLNHVRGSTRCRQATLRVASALGTILMAIVMSHWVDRTMLSDIGLSVSVMDLVRGLAVGSGVVGALFVIEICLGWLKIVGYREVVVPDESLLINLFWDVLFHIGVSINEEISMRGWILVNTA
eukprot:13148585-Ditylum_brightwellii.AAC.1